MKSYIILSLLAVSLSTIAMEREERPTPTFSAFSLPVPNERQAIIAAIKAQNVDEVKEILNRSHNERNLANFAFSYAEKVGNREIINVLMESGASQPGTSIYR